MSEETQPSFSAVVETATLLGGRPIVHLRRDSGPSLHFEIVGVKIAPVAGAAPVEITVKKPDESMFNLLGTSTIKTLDERYQTEVEKKNPFATNEFFKPGVAAPLWPLANRLTGKETHAGVMETEILGQTVTVPVNNGLDDGQQAHHLHGLLFKQTAEQIICLSDANTATAEFRFGHGQFWAGESNIKITQHLKKDRFEFWIEATNTGSAPVPTGLGAHPYFLAPSGDPSSIRLWIPGEQTVDIDNYANVLPVGTLTAIEPRSAMDFNRAGGVPLDGRYLDNLWVDLHLDKDGFAFAEFIDQKVKFRIRLTALTKNIVGIQCYAPKPETNRALGVFAALELVTNLPDPREALWKNRPTGMKLLQPGEAATYGYKIEILPLTQNE